MKLHQSLAGRIPRQTPQHRERQAWQSALASCHGVSALLVDLPAQLAALPSIRPLNKHVVSTMPLAIKQKTIAALIDPYSWPFAPQTFDALLLAWTPLTANCQSRVLTEMDSCLADDGRALVYVAQAHLPQWCRAGMAQAQALGWQLQQQYWGDSRAISLMPPVLARQWIAPWQCYLPVAQWSVQLWQKNTSRLTPIGDNRALIRPSWIAAWPAQQGHSARTDMPTNTSQQTKTNGNTHE